MNNVMEPMNAAELTERQRRLVELVATGLSVQQAATKAGFSPSYARKSSRLLKHPGIAQAIAAIRAEGRTLAAYGLAEAMKEAEDAARFARLKGNAMTLVKSVELRSRLSGLLIERIETVTVDLKGALEAASNRVMMVNAPSPQPCTNPGPATDPGEGLGAVSDINE